MCKKNYILYQVGFTSDVQVWVHIRKPMTAIYHIHRPKEKNYMIVLIDEEKAFEKTQHSFMTKTLRKLGI